MVYEGCPGSPGRVCLETELPPGTQGFALAGRPLLTAAAVYGALSQAHFISVPQTPTRHSCCSSPSKHEN